MNRGISAAFARSQKSTSNMPLQIIPSIFVHSEMDFFDQTDAVRGAVDIVQIDIADGIFVTATTWADPNAIGPRLSTDCELHLMVQNPLETMRRWADVSQVKRVLVHSETINENDLNEIVAYCKERGWRLGLVLNPETPTIAISYKLKAISSVMFMAVHPGAQGQTLIPEVLEKISAFKMEHPDVFVEIDGGVNEETLPAIIKSGVDAICPGSAVFGNNHTPAENVKNMQDLIRELTEEK